MLERDLTLAAIVSIFCLSFVSLCIFQENVGGSSRLAKRKTSVSSAVAPGTTKSKHEI